MKGRLLIKNARLDKQGTLHVSIGGYRFFAGEKYTSLEMGWAAYVAEEDIPEEWMRQYGETRPAEEGWNELASSSGTLVTSHPVLVALALRAWWHGNDRPIPTAPRVRVPDFDEAVDEVRRREILNDFNARHAGKVPGRELRRMDPMDKVDGRGKN